ncbi:MAG: bifunctional folylpolyglutamate synthase/dihydrofolate synthase [Polaribacter sp.]|nr:bifunctional folylpolyglutamate synthase/dihydrofolate synthase [Polaribacter sp.]
MNYQETLDWMFSQLPMYQRDGKSAFKKDLTNILAFSKHLESPEQQFKSVHVGGTNGKGSTSHMIASILQEAGYKVGLYTSPHLKNFTERIRVNGNEVARSFVIDFIAKNKLFLETQGLSFFEMTVGMAFDYFATQKVDIAIIEVGLGGRLDSTNIITPEVAVITNIGLDHTQFLGETLPEIAFEKAGIIKNNTPVIIGERQDEVANVFVETAKKLDSEILFASDLAVNYQTDLLGSYQKRNVKTALLAVSMLKEFPITESQLEKGLLKVVLNTNLKGRWQILQESPKVICDTAHNKEGLTLTLQQLKKEHFNQLHIVLGVVSDKKLADILALFPKKATYYFCQPNIPRALPVADLMYKANEYQLFGNQYASVNEAYISAKAHAGANDVVYIGGSTFVVAEVL